jgi:hypothetical protein
MFNRSLNGPRWFKKGRGILWVHALEWQRRGVIRYHTMFAGMQHLRRLSWMERWNELAGFARIESIRDSQAVRRYVTKYVVKEGELDLGGTLLIEQPPPFCYGYGIPRNLNK